jgi:hypothetical protein
MEIGVYTLILHKIHTSLLGSLIPMLIPNRGWHTGLITLVFSSIGCFSDYVLFRFVYLLIFFQVVTSLRNTWSRDPLLEEEESIRAIATCQQLVNPVTSSLLLYVPERKKNKRTTLNLNSYCNLQHHFMFTANLRVWVLMISCTQCSYIWVELCESQRELGNFDGK